MFTNGKVPVFVNRELLKSEPISEACLRQKINLMGSRVEA